MSQARVEAEIGAKVLLQKFGAELDEQPENERTVVATGSFGSVINVKVKGAACVAKRIHGILLGTRGFEPVSESQWVPFLKKFTEECELLSEMRHPNIVQFIGVCELVPGEPRSLALVMERLYTDLGKYIGEARGEIPLSIKLSILYETSSGLLYIHSRNILHRDLNAGNVLLTESLRAKIADFGVARDTATTKKLPKDLTQAPGCQDYMPPESREENPKYDSKLDCFSFGHLMLYLVIQKCPTPNDPTYDSLHPHTLPCVDYQIQKRQKWIDEVGQEHCLYSLITSCLRDVPRNRPGMYEINHELESLHKAHPRKTGPSKDLDQALQLETMQQKHATWMKRAEDLTNKNKLLEREMRILEEERDSLNGTVEMLQRQLQQYREHAKAELRLCQVTEKELQRKVQEQQAMTESILKELESNQMEMTCMAAKLEAVTAQHKELLAQLEESQRLINIHQDKNMELKRMLEEASNPAKLRAIEHKMVKYKQEMDQAKEELRLCQVTEEELCQKDQEQQAMTESLLKELESNRMEMTHMAVKLEAMTTKRKHYKQECRQLQQLVDSMHHELETKEMEVTSLQNQIAQLTGAITEQVDSHFSAEEQEKLTSVYSNRENKIVVSSRQASHPDMLVPLSHDQDEFASLEPILSTRGTFREPSRSSRQQGSQEYQPSLTSSLSKPTAKQSRTAVVASLSAGLVPLTQMQSPRVYNDLSHEERESGFPVRTADGLVNMELRKPSGDMKKHTRVVVKRGNGDMIMGTLMYFGKPDKKELAGVVLDIKRAHSSRRTPRDGTFKNGERYFECSPGYGMYTPMSNIFIPVHSENKMVESSSKPTSQTKKESRGKAPDSKSGVEESHPDDKKCPLCGKSVGLGKGPFHYLKCKGYYQKDDKSGSRLALNPHTSKLTSQTKKESRRKAPDSEPSVEESHSPRETKGAISHQPATYLVTFLWRPLKPLTFKKVTLLSHLQVEMKLNSQHGYYISDLVEASEGEFDGQVIFGESYCYTLKKFVVDKSSLVVLELDVSKMKESVPEDTCSGGYYYHGYASEDQGSSSGISV